MLERFKQDFVPFPAELKKTKEVKSRKTGKVNELTFVEWYHYVARAQREWPNGFTSAVTCIKELGSYLYMVVRVSDPSTGEYHDGIGLADVDKDKDTGFGGAGPEAYSQAIRRAFACFGMGLEMYLDDEGFEAVVRATKDRDAAPDEEPDEDDAEPNEGYASRAGRELLGLKLKELDETLPLVGDPEIIEYALEHEKRAGARKRLAARLDEIMHPEEPEEEDEELDEEDGPRMTDRQKERIKDLWDHFYDHDLDDLLDGFKDRVKTLTTKAAAGRFIRDMKAAADEAGAPYVGN